MPPPQLTEGELKAERIYYAAISRRFTHKEATLAAKWLAFEHPDGAAYLRWLLSRGDVEWPTESSLAARRSSSPAARGSAARGRTSPAPVG